jgi:hypothetical protein
MPLNPSSIFVPTSAEEIVDAASTGPSFLTGATISSTSSEATTQSAESNTPNVSSLPYKNPLSRFSSYSCIFTLGVLTDNELNFPDDTYIKNGPEIILLKSGGTTDKQVKTAYEKSLGITTEYYIDDVEIDSIIAPNNKSRQTNATGIRFSVYEPYSMGIFLQTMSVAAYQATQKNGQQGTGNYLEVPYVLMVDFVGWDDKGNSVNVPQSRRIFPMKFIDVRFNVDAGGSHYSVEAIPYNETALSDEVQTIKEDVDIKGETVADILQIEKPNQESLTSLLNKREKRLESSGNKGIGDSFVIYFEVPGSSGNQRLAANAADESGALDVPPGIGQTITEVNKSDISLEGIQEFVEDERNISEIGLSKIQKTIFDSGEDFYGEGDESQLNTGIFKRDAIKVDSEGTVRLNFKKGTRLQDIIEEVILLSEYGRNLYLRAQEPTNDGMITWFRIETDVYNISDDVTLAKAGRSAKVYVYRVVLFETHVSRFYGPTDLTPGVDKLKQQAVKEYDYIYSGQNDDVLDFEIAFNVAFFKALTPDLGQLGQDARISSSSSTAAINNETIFSVSNGNQSIPNSEFSRPFPASYAVLPKPVEGGGTQNHPETQIARVFNEAMVNSNVDLITAEMEIWGDPYYIADSGMGNYNAGSSSNAKNITNNNTINYQARDVDILVNFKTPIDIGKDGLMAFPADSGEPVAEFSGLYQVVTVTNKIQSNRFTQTLSLIRRPNQFEGDSLPKGGMSEGGEEASLSPFIEQTDSFGFSLVGVSSFSDFSSVFETAEDTITGVFDGITDTISDIIDIAEGVGTTLDVTSNLRNNNDD